VPAHTKGDTEPRLERRRGVGLEWNEGELAPVGGWVKEADGNKLPSR
jgi:hypothetical protein